MVDEIITTCKAELKNKLVGLENKEMRLPQVSEPLYDVVSKLLNQSGPMKAITIGEIFSPELAPYIKGGKYYRGDTEKEISIRAAILSSSLSSCLQRDAFGLNERYGLKPITFDRLVAAVYGDNPYEIRNQANRRIGRGTIFIYSKDSVITFQKYIEKNTSKETLTVIRPSLNE